MSGVANELLSVLADRTCLVGMGNPWRNDDGVGVHVALELNRQGCLPAHIEVMNVEDVIESYAFDIADRAVENIVLVDAATSPGAPAGSIVFGKVDELEAATSDFSTHKPALRTVESVFRHSGKQTYLLGIVPANLDFGNEMSPPVLAAAASVVDLVRSASRRLMRPLERPRTPDSGPRTPDSGPRTTSSTCREISRWVPSR